MSTVRKSGIFVMLAGLWLCASGWDGTAQTYPVTDPGTTFTTLHSFNGTDGRLSFAGLMQATNGKLYGTTYYGGTKDSGEVFEISLGGTLKTFHSFCSKSDCADGEYTYAVPVQGTDGNLYGTTYLGGSKELGTVFKMTPSGTAITLHTFGGSDGSQPLAGLVQGSDGNFYGTTNMGGSEGGGTIFKITPSGALTTMHNFCSQSGCADGRNPYAALVQGIDGNLYGTTLEGGAKGFGTIFKITPSGTLTTLHSFCTQNGCPDGQFPQTGLVQGSNGTFYGTTITGGAYGDGTIFEIIPSGTLTTLYNVCPESGCPDGNYLYAGLIQATDGNLYGIMDLGGVNGAGTIFKLTLSGTLTTLYNFCSQSGCPDGQYPAGELVQETDGNLYGTTADGGTNGDGTVFRLSLGLAPFVITEPTAANVGATVKILGTNLSGATSVTFNGTNAVFKVVSSTEIKTKVPKSVTTGPVQVVTPGGILTSNGNFQVN